MSENTFGDRLKTVLKENNLKQKDLAELLNIHINTVSQWIRNLREPDLKSLRLIVHFLDTNYLWLITGETPEEYAARKKAQRVADDFAAYQIKKEEYRETLRQFFLLSERKQELVKKLIEELSKGDNR